MKKEWRTVQPPHESPNVTLEQAREAWRKVMAREEARRQRRRKRRPAAVEAVLERVR